MIFKAHDLPIKHWDVGVSFHASESPVDVLYWDGVDLEVVLVNGEMWGFDFDAFAWKRQDEASDD